MDLIEGRAQTDTQGTVPLANIEIFKRRVMLMQTTVVISYRKMAKIITTEKNVDYHLTVAGNTHT